MLKVVEPVFMPIAETRTGKVSHYEALARAARMGTDGHVKLISLGEEYGFVDLIDMAIMSQVFAVLETQPQLVLAVNVSVVTIEQSCGDVLSLIFKHMDVVPRVIFEITETSEIHDHDLVSRFVMAVRLLKGRVAIDDYGAGHFTLPIVQSFRPDFLKLSNVLVADLDRTAGEVERLRELTHQFGGQVIAEHVDTRAKFDRLRGLGVQYAQGYFVGRPVQSPWADRTPAIRSASARLAVHAGREEEDQDG